jgi:hypothetical protein
LPKAGGRRWLGEFLALGCQGLDWVPMIPTEWKPTSPSPLSTPKNSPSPFA